MYTLLNQPIILVARVVYKLTVNVLVSDNSEVECLYNTLKHFTHLSIAPSMVKLFKEYYNFTNIGNGHVDA